MASLSGNLHRPLSAMAALAVAAASTDLPDKFPHSKASASNHAVSENKGLLASRSSGEVQSWVPQITVSNLSGLFQKPLGNSTFTHMPDFIFHKSCSSPAPPPAILSPYQYAKLCKSTDIPNCKILVPSSSSNVMYRWHLPDPNAHATSGNSICSAAKSQTVVVLLGWLGAQQKHLKRYAEWYTSKGFHAVTFTFPMADVMSYKVGGKAEQNLELLAAHLAGWVAEEQGKNLVFHTFSNTGWLTYGVVLEKFRMQDPTLMERIKGCVVDSAPVAAADPQVWASGFSAAFLKKQSVATRGAGRSNDPTMSLLVSTDSSLAPKPAVAETALLAVLEKFFQVVLNLPSINRRLSDVLEVLSVEQPKCPQLYIYSSADRVIPVKSVESFIETQKRAGHEVRACDFISSPHVDHFRSHPGLYTSQLTTFLEECVLTCCKDSS